MKFMPLWRVYWILFSCCMCRAGKKASTSEVIPKTFTVLVCMCALGKIDLSQYFLPRLHIYVGGISLVNIGLIQILRSWITVEQTLLSALFDAVWAQRKGERGSTAESSHLSRAKVKMRRRKWNASDTGMPRRSLGQRPWFVFLKSGAEFSSVT